MNASMFQTNAPRASESTVRSAPHDAGTFAKAPTGNPSLGATVQLFARHWSPRLITASLLVCLPVRLWLGNWTHWDAALALGLIAFQPVNEWLIHVFVLHLRPRKIGPWTLDFRLAKKHRAHHLNPWDVDTLFIPVRTLVISLIVESALFFTLLPTHALAMSALTTTVAIGLFYEWSHFLPHSAYRPKLKWWRDVVKFHRLHHFKNENYWMGVSSNFGDMLLGTFPNVRDVPNSDTVRTLLSRGDETAERANAG